MKLFCCPKGAEGEWWGQRSHFVSISGLRGICNCSRGEAWIHTHLFFCTGCSTNERNTHSDLLMCLSIKTDEMWCLLQVGCIAAQWCLYGFELSTDFSCGRYPCPMRVDCFLSHAWEKTVFLRIMFTASSVSILLNVVEAVCMLRAKLRRTDGGETLQPGSEVEESVLSRLLALWHSHAGFLGTVKKNLER